ncbi:up-regulator of cell proliferation-like [Pelobates cultripes]|uniref:Up-regulator of cell proliferation-like n=1 Tax=Pelobates cultripes TaxID=61616 RepID=A0AAD1SSA5_PELCU|nr:up-regulator of cell proliferation-like [Pelobates cultripes]
MSSHRYPTKPAASDREDSPLNVVQPKNRKGEGSARRNTQHAQEVPKLHVRKNDVSGHPLKTNKCSMHMSPEPDQRPGEDNRSFQPDFPPLRPDSSQYLQDKSGYMAMRSVLDVTHKDTLGTNTCERDEDKEVKPVNVNDKIRQFGEPVVWRKWPIDHKHSMAKQKTNSQSNKEILSNTLQVQGSQPMWEENEGGPSIPKSQSVISGESPEFTALVSRLKMGEYRETKLTLQDVFNIGQESMNDIELRTVENIPWYFLQNVMALNVNARNTTLKEPAQSAKTKDSLSRFQCFNDDEETDLSDSVHPLDVLCVLLNCSDHFLQQEIITKMSMCQFAVPLLLPAGDGFNCTFMLWAMRDIVKRWRPHSLVDSKGFMEDNVVNIPMPTFSFVRLGKCTLSKSKFLNHLLSPAHAHYSIFVNQDMDCGNYPRNVSDGLVEISWFFPGGTGNSETFPEPFAVSSLHGDLKYNLAQFTFLTQISAAVFVFIESFTEEDYIVFSQLTNTKIHYYFVLSQNNDKQKMQMTRENLKKLSQELKVGMIKTHDRNAIQSVNDIQLIILGSMKDKDNQLSLENMIIKADKHKIKVDEDSVECQEARKHALSITRKIKDVAQYKKDTMRLQGDLWKEISGLEKEMCRMKNQGRCNTNTYRNQLIKKCFDLTKTQYQHQVPEGMKNFITSVTKLTGTEKCYFMKWMKFYLDSISRDNVPGLQAEYRRKSIAMSANTNELKGLSQNISDSSLGIEHFLREMGQFYEAECSMIKQKQISSNQRQFSHLPGIAADLLLGGFPLELIDGDASNIPLQWITDVLIELDTKTGGRCRMRVITVLGVQSTGKSTLLNTMFGLQFPVASGRCTRGAFMTLIKVKEDVRQGLGCDFILVIDTEGLKAPELSSMEDSYEHDNELATLVVGLSDITIINMAMENSAEMKDTLQIVVHAFLRMSEVGKKPNCHLVHQNVSDVTAHDKNMVGRANLLKELNDMTKVAAKMERRNKSMEFSDIIDYDPERYTWYIPGLWHGVPPMAPVNQGYSENVFKLRKYIFGFLKGRQSSLPQNTRSFIEWIKSLWNAVKHETFIFSFRNILVAEAYDQLSMKYSELEWDFRKRVHSHLATSENVIKNQYPENLQTGTSDMITNDIKNLLDNEEANMTNQLILFFKSGCANVHLVERYREDFLIHVKSLRKDLEVMASSKCWETVRIQNYKSEIQNMQSKFQESIEEKILKHLEIHKMSQSVQDERELKLDFDAFWDNILTELKVTRLRKHRIDVEILEQLKREMKNRPGAVNEKLNNVKSLKDYAQKRFDVIKDYIDIVFFSMKGIKEFFTKDCFKKLSHIARSLTADCHYYVMEKVNTKEDYNEVYCQEILFMINRKLDKAEVRKLQPTSLFEVDLKLHILGKAAPLFQKMHDDFGVNNDPKLLLNRFKPQYFSIFKNRLQHKDKSRNYAKQFYEQCLKPAVFEYIYKNLGKEIIDDMFQGVDAMRFRSRKHFQFSLLKDLLAINRFENYFQYVSQYENYVKNWISKYIAKKYGSSISSGNFLSKILSSITEKVRAALRDRKVQNSKNVSELLEIFSVELNKHLVLSKNAMKVTGFQNTSSIHQFSKDIEYFLNTMEKEFTSNIKSMDIETFFSNLTLKPHDELFQKIIGCGKKCPFCEVPCEAAGTKHENHFVTIHRPKGLAEYMWSESNVLCNSICSTDVLSNDSFINSDTDGKWHQYKDYRTIYPDWTIQPDRDMSSSNYWKYVLKQFNEQFAECFNAGPAEIPPEWQKITQTEALRSLQEMYNLK